MRKNIVSFILFFAIIFSSVSTVGQAVQIHVINDYECAEKAVLEAWKNLEDSLDISEFKIDKSKVNDFCNYVSYKNTECFYVDFSNEYYYSTETGYIATIYFDYLFDKSEIEKEVATFNEECEKILARVPENVSVEEKLLILHDYLAAYTRYDKRVYYEEKYEEGNIRTSYGCIVEQVAVCEGISEAFMCLCKLLDIEAYAVTSTSMHHEWNMVKIGENYYHIDITQDAPVYYLGKYGYHQAHGDITHKFFLKSDEQIKKGELGQNAHYDWIAPYYATDSKTYANAFWNEASGKVNYKYGKYYYIKEDKLVEYTYSTKTTKTLYHISDEVWDCTCGKFHKCKGEYSRSTVSEIRDFVYFSSGNNVYSYNINNGGIRVIFSRPGKGFIYSLVYQDGKVYVSIRDDEAGKNYKNDYTDVHPFYTDLSFVVSGLDITLLAGDVDGNGSLNIVDLLALRKYHLKVSENIDRVSSDVYLDGVIDMKDILVLTKTVVNSK